MPKLYTVDPKHHFASTTPLNTSELRADTVDHEYQETEKYPAIGLRIDTQADVFIDGAGKHGPVDFTTTNAIYTQGLAHCFAVCAVWGKLGANFTKGYLAHLSAPKHSRYAVVLKEIDKTAWIVVDMSSSTMGWQDEIIKKLTDAGFEHDHIWLYVRSGSQNSFGIDKEGRFGEL